MLFHKNIHIISYSFITFNNPLANHQRGLLRSYHLNTNSQILKLIFFSLRKTYTSQLLNHRLSAQSQCNLITTVTDYNT